MASSSTVSCTSAIGRRASFALALAVCTFWLQGCGIPRHVLGYWESAQSYQISYAYAPPGTNSSSVSPLNSCSLGDVPLPLRCSGRGQCVDWFGDAPGLNNDSLQLSFCKCDQYWADPECRTERKSQHTAFILSALLGVFGADQFYLGWWIAGSLKLASCGGLGIWYIFDVVRIGSSTVDTQDGFRVAGDLPYFVFLLALVGWMGVLALGISVWSIMRQRAKKALEIMMLRAEASGHSPGGDYEFQDKSVGMHGLSLVTHADRRGYGSTGRAFHLGGSALLPFHGYGTTLAGGGAGIMRPI